MHMRTSEHFRTHYQRLFSISGFFEANSTAQRALALGGIDACPKTKQNEYSKRGMTKLDMHSTSFARLPPWPP